jgi:hypothetical protein
MFLCIFKNNIYVSVYNFNQKNEKEDSLNNPLELKISNKSTNPIQLTFNNGDKNIEINISYKALYKLFSIYQMKKLNKISYELNDIRCKCSEIEQRRYLIEFLECYVYDKDNPKKIQYNEAIELEDKKPQMEDGKYKLKPGHHYGWKEEIVWN